MKGDRWLDLACAEATRRHHERSEPAHLLRVVLDDAAFTRDLLERGIDPFELREHVDGVLAGRDSRGGYRDGSAAPSAPALERVFGRMASRGWLARLVRPLTLLDALLLDRSVAALVFEMRRGNDFRHVLERARALAVARGQESIGVDHLFRALVDVRSFVLTVERAGGRGEGMRRVADERLATRPDLGERSEPPIFDDAVRQALGIGRHGAYAGAPPLSVRELCLAIAPLPETDALWAGAGLRGSEFIRAVHVPEEDARRR